MRTLILAGLLIAVPELPAAPKPSLPRFTEEREAAALYFVKKHLPDLLPLLADLKKQPTPTSYQQEICEIFQVSEMLADLDDDARRKLELDVWKAENRSHILVAQLRSATEDEKKKLEEQLKEVARKLVELDIQVMEAQAEQLDKELGELKDELARAREDKEQNARTR